MNFLLYSHIFFYCVPYCSISSELDAYFHMCIPNVEKAMYIFLLVPCDQLSIKFLWMLNLLTMRYS
uniref:Uncharacterized protein n=1 Tax=Arundo donax TaxID=35708 RepID=A0A0A9F5I6_ARUDO